MKNEEADIKTEYHSVKRLVQSAKKHGAGNYEHRINSHLIRTPIWTN